MPIGQPFVQLLEVDSTNNYAIGQVQAHLAEHGTAWFAHAQNAGKGQRGKTWVTEPGENVILSVAIKPYPLKLADQFMLSAVAALSCHDLFSTYIPGDITIKWPNDIYWKDRKAGGILIENIVQGTDWRFSIVGIGLNINQVKFPQHLPNPVSLRQVTGKTFQTIQLAQELCASLESRWQQAITSSTASIMEDYNKNMYKLNEQVLFKNGGDVFGATIKGITKNGELVVINEDGLEVTLSQAEWVLP